MALKVHKVVVVSCPRCVFSSGGSNSPGSVSPGLGGEGIGKSCFCNRFVRPDCFKLQHPSVLSEDEWRDEPVYNGDHFLYWGAATKRMQDGSKVRFQVVEQTEFYSLDVPGSPLTSSTDQRGYIERASSTHFISRGKVAYRLHDEEEYAIPSSLKHNKSSRATQLFPNHEFSDGKASPPSFIVLYDPTLQGENVKIQVEFLTKLVKELIRTKCRVIIACTKCDEVNEGRIQLGANLAATVAKKPLPFIETSSKEGINIEEAFSLVINTSKKKSYSKSIGSYHQIVQSRSKDVTYSTNSFNQLIKDSVSDFNTEWSDVWPYLQVNPACVKVVDVLGIKEVKKLFCQRLMELKVQELRAKRRLSSKEFQSELLEAFSNHPDLSNDSVYDFLYTPPSTPNSKGTFYGSPTAPTPPLTTPTKTPTLPTDAVSPPPPPPTSSIPSLSMDQTTPTKVVLFSPTRTLMNRSSELLANVPDTLLDEMPRDASLRFRYRTLPPLPTQEQFSPLRRLSSSRRLSSTESITKSHPQLDDSASSFTSSGGGAPYLHRRLSNSMDCLLVEATGTLFEEEEEGEEVEGVGSRLVGDIRRESACSEASPYLRPVDVRRELEILNSKQDKSSSCKLPRTRTRPAIPFQMDDSFVSTRSRSFRERAFTSPQLLKQPGFSHEVLPPVPPSAPPLVSPVPPPLPPPPAKKPTTLRKESPLLVGLSSLINTGNSEESSLDCGPRILIDQSTKGEGTGGMSVIKDDTSSVGSGSFAEIDDIDDPDGSIAGGATEDSYRSKSQTPDPLLHAHSSSTLPSRGGYRSLLLMPVNTLPAHMSRSARNSPEKENLYASIPAADEEYLTMRSGVSLEDILSGSNKPRSVSMPAHAAQSVIGKLKSVTSLGSRSKEQTNVESSPHHSPSPRHSQKVVSPSYRPFQSFDEGSSRGFVPVVRPLPPSPNKMNRRAKSMLGSPTKRKISSGGGDNNIYESIDENEEWFKQLRQERALLNQQKMDKVDPELAKKSNTIMSHFLESAQVQELWLEAVRRVIPDFNPPTDASIPPLSINPEYIIRYAKQSTQERHQSPSSNGNDESKEEEEEEEEVCYPPEREEETHRKLTVTDSVLIRMNRSLQQLSSSSSSSSSESETEESDNEESDQEGNEEGETEISSSVGWVSGGQREEVDTLRSETGGSPLTLAVVHQQQTEEENDFIMTCDGNVKEKEEEDEATESEEEEEEEFTSNEDEREETTAVSDMIQSHDMHVMHSDNSSYLKYQSNSPAQSSNKKNETSPIFFTQTQTSPSITTNGHLSVCQLNSLDSGISASNGVADETD